MVTHDVWEANKPDDRHFGVHLIGFGCTPHYLFNRNTDAFSDEATMKKVATFVTHAAVYEEHKHHSRKYAKGQVKFAAYNPKMRRSELIVHVDKDKMPDAYEMVKAGKELGWSMGCKVPGDVSECCGHFSKTPATYCDHMQSRKKQYIPERRKYAFVWNPEPTFFDISRVKRPACRIAYYLSYRLPGDEESKKTATARPDIVAGYANSIEQVKIASVKEDYRFGIYSKTASTIRQFELDVNAHITGESKLSPLFASYVNVVAQTKEASHVDDSVIEPLRNLRPEALFSKLAARHIVLPPHLFLAIALDKTASELNQVPDVMDAIKLAGRGVDICHGYNFTEDDVAQFSGVNSTTDPNDTHEVKTAIDQLAVAFGCGEQEESERVFNSVLQSPGNSIKRASQQGITGNETSRGLAAAYGLYQIAAVHEMQKTLSMPVELMTVIKKIV